MKTVLTNVTIDLILLIEKWENEKRIPCNFSFHIQPEGCYIEDENKKKMWSNLPEDKEKEFYVHLILEK